MRRDDQHHLRNFYIRRIARIAPLYYVAIVVYFLVSKYVHGDGSLVWHGLYDFSVDNVLANVLFLHGFYPSGNNVVVPGGWSIGAEMAFYAIFPAVIFALRRYRRQLGRLLFPALLLAALVIDAAFQYLVYLLTGASLMDGGYSYFSPANQLSTFVAGIIAYEMSAKPRFRQALYTTLTFGLLTIVATRIRHPLETALLPMFAGIAFAGLLFMLKVLVKHEGLLEMLGRASFSMYVFHFLFAWYGTQFIVGLVGHEHENSLYVPTLVGTIAASYGLAWCSKRIIEDPGIEVGRRLIRSLDRRARLGPNLTSR